MRTFEKALPVPNFIIDTNGMVLNYSTNTGTGIYTVLSLSYMLYTVNTSPVPECIYVVYQKWLYEVVKIVRIRVGILKSCANCNWSDGDLLRNLWRVLIFSIGFSTCTNTWFSSGHHLHRLRLWSMHHVLLCNVFSRLPNSFYCPSLFSQPYSACCCSP